MWGEAERRGEDKQETEERNLTRTGRRRETGRTDTYCVGAAKRRLTLRLRQESSRPSAPLLVISATQHNYWGPWMHHLFLTKHRTGWVQSILTAGRVTSKKNNTFYELQRQTAASCFCCTQTFSLFQLIVLVLQHFKAFRELKVIVNRNTSLRFRQKLFSVNALAHVRNKNNNSQRWHS